jgi:hypothetical protein
MSARRSIPHVNHAFASLYGFADQSLAGMEVVARHCSTIPLQDFNRRRQVADLYECGSFGRGDARHKHANQPDIELVVIGTAGDDVRQSSESSDSLIGVAKGSSSKLMGIEGPLVNWLWRIQGRFGPLVNEGKGGRPYDEVLARLEAELVVLSTTKKHGIFGPRQDLHIKPSAIPGQRDVLA